jgi:hypothetical protein
VAERAYALALSLGAIHVVRGFQIVSELGYEYTVR